MKKNRNIYRVLLIVSFIAVNIGILFGISQILSYLSTGADRGSILHLTVKKEQVYLPKITWIDTINPGRPIEKQTLKEIEADYLDAWYVKNIAYKTNDPYGIDDFYTTSARANIYTTIKANKNNQITVNASTLNHQLSLDFYSADGQLAVFTDTNVREYQQVYKNKNLLLESQLNTAYKVVVLLEDGFWKIRHIVKQQTKKLTKEPIEAPLTSIKNGQIYVENSPFAIKGINYYPQATPWDMFGTTFDIDRISKDFTLIKKTGLNTIRIFIQYNDFGKATIKAEKLMKLKQVLDKATENELKVIVTLFDFYGDYSVLNWTLTHRHAEQIVSSFKNHKAILAWDIKNEPDLDFENRGKTNVQAWLREMAYQIKQYDSNHLITIGWSNVASALLMPSTVDFISFHYYQNIHDFESEYAKLRTKTNKPLVLQEFGVSSNRSLWWPLGTSEKKQAEYYKDFMKILDNNTTHYLSWTLYDFTKIPNTVAGKLPWRKYKQKHFGFIDAKGNTKKSFEFITD